VACGPTCKGGGLINARKELGKKASADRKKKKKGGGTEGLAGSHPQIRLFCGDPASRKIGVGKLKGTSSKSTPFGKKSGTRGETCQRWKNGRAAVT